MPWIAGAIAITGLYSAHEAGNAAEEAGELQADAARAQAAESGRQFDITQEQFAPFREAGVSALDAQQALIGQKGPEAEAAALARLEESPAQQFIRNRAQRALLRNASAIGGLGGGNIRRALLEEGAGYARQDIESQFNRLATISGGGQTATTNLGTLRGQTTRDIGSANIQAAQAQASGILGAQQAQAAGLQSLVTAGSIYAGRNQQFGGRPVGVAGVGA